MYVLFTVSDFSGDFIITFYISFYFLRYKNYVYDVYNKKIMNKQHNSNESYLIYA